MNVSYDGSVNIANRARIDAALVACAFPLEYVLMAVTIFVRPNPGHNGRNEALTTITGPGTATIEFAPGLFTPGDPLYVDESFIKEIVIHEIGHVVTLPMSTAQQTPFGMLFGFDYATQWSPAGARWEDMGKEAVAETFKDVFLLPVNRHFLNRTHFQLAGWALQYFVGQAYLTLKITPPVLVGSVTADGSLVMPDATPGQIVVVELVITGPQEPDTQTLPTEYNQGGTVFLPDGNNYCNFRLAKADRSDGGQGIILGGTIQGLAEHANTPPLRQTPFDVNSPLWVRSDWHVADAPVFVSPIIISPYALPNARPLSIRRTDFTIAVTANVYLRNVPILPDTPPWPYPDVPLIPLVAGAIIANNSASGVVR